MGLLNDPFGKEAISRLKNSLTEKANDAIRLQLRLTELERLRTELENEKDRISSLLNTQAQQIQSLQSSTANSQAEINRQNHEHRLAMARLSGSVEEKENANVAMSKRFGDAASEIARLNRELKTLNATMDQIIKASSDKIEGLERQLADQAQQFARLQTENDKQKREIEGLRAFNDNRLKQYQTDKADLGLKAKDLEKSQRDLSKRTTELEHQRLSFQQQAEELRKREAHWKQIIEPQLLKFEVHLTLDEKTKLIEDREAVLQLRTEEVDVHASKLLQMEVTDENLTTREEDVKEWEQLLTERETELKARDRALSERDKELDIQSANLDKQARELDVFRARAARLDDEAANLKLDMKKFKEKEIAQQGAHEQRLADVRQQRSALVKIDKDIADRIAEQNRNARAQDRREASLSSREVAIGQEEVRFAKIQSKNAVLRSDNKSFASKSVQAVRKIARLEKTLEQTLQSVNTEMHIRNFDTVKWIVDSGLESHGNAIPTRIHTHGSGPWEGGDFDEMLQAMGFDLYPCGDYEDTGIEILVVGRDDWSGEAIEAYIHNRGSRPIKVFPQELFVATLACGCDPFDLVVGDGTSKEVPPFLEHFGQGHPVIEFLKSLEFPWPQFNSDVGSPVHPGAWDRVEETPLAILGYHVGIVANLSDRYRRDILAKAFANLELPWVESDEYMESWGNSSSRVRLRRMAHHLAMLIRSNKSKPNFGTAVGQWTSDLEWLGRTYYKSIMRFSWP